MSNLTYIDLGRCACEPALARQLELSDRVRRQAGGDGWLLLVEHDPPVITLGRKSKPDHVLASEQQLTALGVTVHSVSRGGDVTWHGPGQLAAYPIIPLRRRGLGIGEYLRGLEEAVLRTMRRFGIVAGRIDGLTGVWAGEEKLAAIGVAVRGGVTCHGLALNVCPDLRGFDLIVPCGIEGKGVASMQRLLGRAVMVDEVKQPLAQELAAVLGFTRLRREGDDGP